jgi:hypothetical protein
MTTFKTFIYFFRAPSTGGGEEVERKVERETEGKRHLGET